MTQLLVPVVVNAPVLVISAKSALRRAFLVFRMIDLRQVTNDDGLAYI
jgi:hypothetical protein